MPVSIVDLRNTYHPRVDTLRNQRDGRLIGHSRIRAWRRRIVLCSCVHAGRDDQATLRARDRFTECPIRKDIVEQTRNVLCVYRCVECGHRGEQFHVFVGQ